MRVTRRADRPADRQSQHRRVRRRPADDASTSSAAKTLPFDLEARAVAKRRQQVGQGRAAWLAASASERLAPRRTGRHRVAPTRKGSLRAGFKVGAQPGGQGRAARPVPDRAATFTVTAMTSLTSPRRRGRPGRGGGRRPARAGRRRRPARRHGVTVVVDFHELGGGVQQVCDPDGGGDRRRRCSRPRLPARLRAAPARASSAGSTACRPSDPCVNTPPTDAYWGLWWSDGEVGSWAYCQLGAAR